MELSEEQLVPVMANNSIIVIAGPGSGKTKSMVAKACREALLGNDVVIITYTSAASKEIKKRLSNSLSQHHQKMILVGTFHSLLIKHINISELQFSMLNPDAEHVYLQKVYSDSNGSMKGFLSFENYVDNSNYGAKNINHKNKEEYDFILEDYVELMFQQKKYDLNQVVNFALENMKNGMLDLFQHDWMLVDEFQDLDQAQYEFVLLHALSDVKTCVVGDCDQSLYSFRNGKGYYAFSDFIKHTRFPVCYFSNNYRTKSEILNAAYNIVENNINRLEKKWVPTRGNGGNTSVRGFNCQESEADWVVSRIQNSQSKSVAIIARNRNSFDAVRSLLIEKDIKHSFNSSNSFLDDPLVKLSSAIMISLVDKDLSSLSVQIGFITKNNEASTSMAKSILFHRNIINNPILSSLHKANQNINNPTQFISEISSFLSLVGPFLGFSNISPAEFYLKNLLNIKGSMKQRLVLNSFTSPKEDHISLLTAHSSKGLEFEQVFVIDMTKDTFPKKHTKKFNVDFEEERRVAFVAFTRAKDHLYVSYRSVKKIPEPSPILQESGLL